jgi:phage shock protein C
MHSEHLFLRNDTILGVCEAIGRDFGFHPNWLRAGLAVALFFAPFAVIGGYVALAVPVAFARWMYPARSAAQVEQLKPTETSDAVNEGDQQVLPLAA